MLYNTLGAFGGYFGSMSVELPAVFVSLRSGLLKAGSGILLNINKCFQAQLFSSTAQM